MNFLGVLIGGIAVAYALVELLPAEVLSPPDGGPAVAMLVSLGERLGSVHLTPAQGASAELVSATLISIAGLTGLPVSTTHIVTSGIAGTMVTSGAGLRYSIISRIVIAWVLTLPVTILVSATLYFFLLAAPVIAP